MTPIRTPSTNVVLKAHGCADLPATKVGAVFSSAWQLSEEERALIAAGRPVILSIIAHGHPPVSLDVEP